jgi:dipeptide/tripeptide permease
MQAHIIAFGMVAIGMSWLVRQAGTASRPVAALAALVIVCLQVCLCACACGSNCLLQSAFNCILQSVLSCMPGLTFLTVSVKTQIGLHYTRMDQSGNEYVKHYGEMHLAKLPRNAILVVKGDVITNSIRYLQVNSLCRDPQGA